MYAKVELLRRRGNIKVELHSLDNTPNHVPPPPPYIGGNINTIINPLISRGFVVLRDENNK